MNYELVKPSLIFRALFNDLAEGFLESYTSPDTPAQKPDSKVLDMCLRRLKLIEHHIDMYVYFLHLFRRTGNLELKARALERLKAYRFCFDHFRRAFGLYRLTDSQCELVLTCFRREVSNIVNIRFTGVGNYERAASFAIVCKQYMEPIESTPWFKESQWQRTYH